MRNLAKSIAGIVAVLVLVLSNHLKAENLPAPAGEVLLTITGTIDKPNVGSDIQLDMALLESFPVVEFTTDTPWDNEPQHFEGVRVNVLLDAIGANSRQFVAVGLDDYKFTVSDLDFDQYPIIIAYRQNGHPISVRKLGPLRIMMPFDDFPELLTQQNESRSVWQLVSMELL